MSATDTKKTPKSTGYVKIPSVAYIETMQYLNKCEADLTAVTAQRDRALDVAKNLYGCLKRTKRECDDVDHSGGHCHEDHEECPVWKMIETAIAEYEALRKGER